MSGFRNEATPLTSQSTRAESPTDDAETSDDDDNSVDDVLQGVQEVSFKSDINVGDYILVNVPIIGKRKLAAKKFIALVQESKEDVFGVLYLKMLKPPDLFILNQHDSDIVSMDNLVNLKNQHYQREVV